MNAISGVSRSVFPGSELKRIMLTAWTPGLGVKIDYAAIVEILIEQLDDQPDRALNLTNLVCFS